MFKRKIIDVLVKLTQEESVFLETPEIEDFGDYSTNVAMTLAKKEGKNPKEIAQDLTDKLKNEDLLKKEVDKIDVAGPGFINFWLSKSALLENLQKISEDEENYGISDYGKGKTVLVEYSSPNIAKTFGVGHLRSTIIGQALKNLFTVLGYKTISENHLGDWGTQFGMIIAQIVRKGLKAEDLSVENLEELYIEFNREMKEKPDLRDEAKDWFRKLEGGDPKARKIWEVVRETSVKEFERIYKKLGVSFENMHGESFYEDKMPGILGEIRTKGLAKKSEGVEIVEFSDMTPAMLVKSDGTSTYFTRDLATVKYRIETFKPDLMIYEVGSDQILHLRQVFETAKQMGWTGSRQFVHVPHGLIRFPEGKMSTREGKIIKLEKVLEEAVKKAHEIIDKSETGRGLSEEEKNKVAEVVGIGAIKYFDLMHHPKTDIIFDWEKIFVLQGNSAPYLQYSYARTQSVLAKSEFQNPNPKNLDLNAEELLILRSLIRFSEVLVSSAINFSPNLLTNYLFDLAQKYNNFYNQHRIIGGENEIFRLMLTKELGFVLKKGLTILGIDTPVKM